MNEHTTILVTGSYIAYQSVGTQFIGGTHAHSYPAAERQHTSDRRLVEDIESEDKAAAEASLFCLITQAAYDKGVAEDVERQLRSACVSAPKLIRCIRLNEALGYLDTQNLTSAKLHQLLNEHFHLPFGVRALQMAREK